MFANADGILGKFEELTYRLAQAILLRLPAGAAATEFFDQLRDEARRLEVGRVRA
jgi:hypothetical protein